MSKIMQNNKFIDDRLTPQFISHDNDSGCMIKIVKLDVSEFSSKLNKSAFIFSFILHTILYYLLLFGISHTPGTIQEEQIISFEILPVASKSNVPNKDVQKEKPLENDDAKKVQQNKEEPKVEKLEEVKPIEAPKMQEPVPELQEPEPPKSMSENAEPKPLPTPAVKPAEQLVPDQKPTIFKQKTSLPEKPKTKPKIKDIMDKKDLDKLLKNLEQSSEGDNAKSTKYSRTQKTGDEINSKGPYHDDLPISISEFSMIKQQIERFWNIPIAGQDLRDARITIYISLNSDGSIARVKLIEKSCANLSDNMCAALADSAMRAAWQASPIENLDIKRYNLWKEFNMRFDPSKL